MRDEPWSLVIALHFLLVAASIPSVLVQRRGKPVGALSWIFALIMLPGVGLFLWWLLARTHLTRKRRRRFRAGRIMSGEFSLLARSLPQAPQDRISLLPLPHLPRELDDSVFPATSYNDVRLLVDATIAYEQMLSAIEQARHHIHVLFYIWQADETGGRFRDALARKAREGVEVRLLFDDYGSPRLRGRFMSSLRETGAKVAPFMPLRLNIVPAYNFRNHRKLVIIDGRVGFAGGINIGDEHLRAWHDCAIRIEGPALDQLQEVFADDWYFATRENLAEAAYFGKWHNGASGGPGSASVAVVASGPDTRHNAMHDLVFFAINETRKRLWLMTPYFIPSASMMTALRTAVYRGVDVRIIVPEKSDVPLVRRASRSYYADLLEVGVRIFEYRPVTLHAKAIVFDEHLALIGSANLDTRSFRLNFEASCFIGSVDFNRELAEVIERDLSNSHEILLEDIERLPWSSQVIDSAAHLLSPLL